MKQKTKKSQTSSKKGVRKEFECNHCSYSTSYKLNLKRHINEIHIQPNFRPFACKFCPYAAKQKIHLDIHVKAKHILPETYRVNYLFACKLCSFACKEKITLNKHLAAHNVCSVCQCVCESISSLREHLLSHESSYQCSVCQCVCESISSLREHLLIHESSYQCSVCQCVCESISSLREHLLEHKSGEPSSLSESNRNVEEKKFKCKPYRSLQKPKWRKCKHCPFECHSTSTLRGHMKLHGSKGAFRCKHCTYSTTKLHFLSKHLKLHGNKKASPDIVNGELRNPPTQVAENSVAQSEITETKFERDVCPLTSRFLVGSSDSSRNVQEKMHKCKPHSGIMYRYKCRHCPYKSRTASALWGHMRLHGSKGSIRRKDCSNSASKWHVLNDHLKLHEYDRTSLDNVNGEQPSPPKKLSVVQRKMTEKKFKCEICPYTSTFRTGISSHMIMHGAKAQHKCNHCSYSTVYAKILKRHLLLHREESAGTGEEVRSPPDNADGEVPNPPKILMKYRVAQGETIEKKFKCKMCPYTSNYRSSLPKHEQMHANEGQHKCRNCSFSTEYASVLERHLLLHAGESAGSGEKVRNKVPQESHPGASLDTVNSELSKPLKKLYSGVAQRQITEKKFRCEICPYTSNFRSVVRYHMSMHNKEARHKCRYCSFSTSYASDLERHLLLHAGEPAVSGEVVRGPPELTEREYKCSSCPYATKSQESFHIHRTMHGHKGIYKCKYCTYSARRPSFLTRHLILHRGKKRTAFGNKVSRKTSEHLDSSMTRLSAKQKLISNRKSVSVHRCSSKNKANLLLHLRVHSDKVFHCTLCPYRCKGNQSLVKHLKDHEIDKCETYKCSLCFFSSKYWYNLKRHEKSHGISAQVDEKLTSGEENEAIGKAEAEAELVAGSNVCGGTLAKSEDLEAGAKVHSDMIQCTVCYLTFNSVQALKIHLFKHTEEKRWFCELCSYAAVQKGTLDHHVRTKHTEK